MKILGEFEIEGGNELKLFNDLAAMLKNHPDAKFKITSEEQTLTKD